MGVVDAGKSLPTASKVGVHCRRGGAHDLQVLPIGVHLASHESNLTYSSIVCSICTCASELNMRELRFCQDVGRAAERSLSFWICFGVLKFPGPWLKLSQWHLTGLHGMYITQNQNSTLFSTHTNLCPFDRGACIACSGQGQKGCSNTHKHTTVSQAPRALSSC